MKKIFSSSVLLLFLLLLFWFISAWILGVKNEENIKNFINKLQIQDNSFIQYKLLSFDRSILNSTVEIQFSFNKKNMISQYVDGFSTLKETYSFNLDVSHGPILFDEDKVFFWDFSIKTKFK